MELAERVWRERGLHRAVLSGDSRAWHDWYDESFEVLDRFVCWRCAGLRDLADDVLQETWLTAVRRIRHFDPEEGCFLAWLCGIAANILRNHRRLRERRAVRLAALAVQRSNADDDAEVDQREQAELVSWTLAALPDHYEAVLRAKYLDQQSVAQIAVARRETVKATESLLTRARQSFRDLYSQRNSSHE